jgi:ferritin
MVSQEVQDGINAQVGRELYAAYLYLGMMTWFERRSLTGFGQWMRVQAREEIAHAMRLVDFLIDRGGAVELRPIEKPDLGFEKPLDVMKAALAHERKVTASINDLYALAVASNDYPAQVLMQWFVSEQVEEEKNAGEIVDRLELAGDSASALLVLDGRLGARGPAGQAGVDE